MVVITVTCESQTEKNEIHRLIMLNRRLY